MKQCIVLGLLLACLSSIGAGENLITKVALLDNIVSPGDLTLICLRTKEPVKSIRAEIWLGEKLVKSLKGSVLDPNTGTSVVQLPFGSLWSMGTYKVKVFANFDQDRFEQANLSVEVREKKFNQEIIALNSSNTAIKTEPNKLKDEQIERMAKLLSLFDPKSPFMGLPFQRPLDEIRLTSNYGDRRVYQYSNGKKEVDDHRGLDYGATEGTPVRSGVEGLVVMVENRVTTGNTVIVQIGPGSYVLYFHLKQVSVKLGDLVQRHTEIGLVGKTGLATGPHLHFEVQVQGVSIDPTPFYARPFIDIDAINRVLSSNNL